MCSFLAIAFTPRLQVFRCIHNDQEPAPALALDAKAVIARLDVCIVGRLARPRKGERDPALTDPAIYVARFQLAPLVRPAHPRVANLPADAVPRRLHVLAEVALAHVEHGHKTLDDVEHSKHSQLPAGREALVKKARLPDLIRADRVEPMEADTSLHSPLHGRVPQLQA